MRMLLFLSGTICCRGAGMLVGVVLASREFEGELRGIHPPPRA